jgi:hypothetical protein
MTELWRLGASELAEAIRSKKVSAREAVTAHLERIQRVNPSVNAVTAVLAENALAEAAVLDERLARGESCGPLGGVPFTVKDRPPPRASPLSPAISPMRTPHTSPSSGPREGSQSRAPTSPTSACVGIARTPCEARHRIPGTEAAPRAGRPGARPWRSPPA